MLASHVMYNGIGKDALLDLAPGSNFTRTMNMTEYLIHDVVDHTQPPRTITISLPPTFQGRKHHGSHGKPRPDSPGRFSGAPGQAGDALKAIYSDIPLRSSPLQVTIANQKSFSVLGKREEPLFNGIKIAVDEPLECKHAQFQNLSNAILHSGFLGVAGLNAASNYHALPFNYFLPATIEASNKVGRAMSNLVQAAQGKGPPVLATCIDAFKMCPGGVFGYAMYVPGGHPTYIPRVVICPVGLMLPDVIQPCEGLPGVTTTAYVLIHEVMHIDSISGIRADDWDRPHNWQSARNVHKDVLAGKDTTTDAVALGLLPCWSWELGLGAWGGKPCLEKFYQGDLDSLVTVNGIKYSG